MAHTWPLTTTVELYKALSPCHQHSSRVKSLMSHRWTITVKMVQITSWKKNKSGHSISLPKFCKVKVTLQRKFLHIICCLQNRHTNGSDISKKILWRSCLCENPKDSYQRECSLELLCKSFGQDGISRALLILCSVGSGRMQLFLWGRQASAQQWTKITYLQVRRFYPMVG